MVKKSTMDNNTRFEERLEIGYCAAGDISGFPIDYLKRINKEGSDALRDLGYNINEFPKILSDYRTAHEIIDYFSAQKVGIVVVNVAGWIEAGILLKIIRNLKSVFFVLWAFGNYNETLTLTGLIENTCMLRNANCNNYCSIIGPPDESEVKKEIVGRLRTLCLSKTLESICIGMIGSNCPGMIDSTFDEVSLRGKIGCDVKHLDLTELIENYHSIPEETVSNDAKRIQALIGGIEVTDKTLLRNIKLYYALKMMIETHNLEAFAIRCWPELKNNILDLDITPCFAISRLSDEGTIGSCEADVSAALTMVILKYLSGNTPVSLDYNTVDIERNSLTLWHCGANAMGLASSWEEVKFRRPTNGGLMELNCGMSVEFAVKPGKVILSKISRDFTKMIMATGRIVKPKNKYRGGICEVVLDVNAIDYLKQVVNEGIEHHICVVHGDIERELQTLAELLMIQRIVV